MASKATVYKAELQVTDLDRHYYASHNLTLAQHPSETDERLMVRLLAFALHADERLEFGRGLSDEDEPALWRRDYTGTIEQWIELGQPDESRLRKAGGARTARGRRHLWRQRRRAVVEEERGDTRAPAQPDGDRHRSGQRRVASPTLLDRGMRLTAMIQDGELQLMDAGRSVALRPDVRQAASVDS